MMHKLAIEKPQKYSYDDLVRFTSNFAVVLSSGLVGIAYGGHLSNGVKVAITVLRDEYIVEDASFVTVVGILGNTCHPNVHKIYGFFSEGRKRALVCEYTDKGSFDQVLYNNPHGTEWDNFYFVAIEMAKALAYLHDDRKIIHCDFEASHVLLDSSLRPKLTSFGLANLTGRDQTHFSLTEINVARGYPAPEVRQSYSNATSKSDVYSFGMLLLEILRMMPSTDGGFWFTKLVWDKLEKHSLGEVLVACGIKEKHRKKATILSVVAMWCLQYTPAARPSMRTVTLVLEKELFVNKPTNPMVPLPYVSWKMQPQKFPGGPSFTNYRKMDVPQKLKHVEEEQSQEESNAGSSSTKNIMEDRSAEKQIRYSYSDLKKISQEFKYMVGSGSFGEVFKGQLPNGVKVAIKVLKMNNIVEQTFLAEVKTMSNTKHQNLIKLIGFCSEGKHRALVYVYMEMGSLDTILYNKPLSIEWGKLYGIAIGTARAVAHLHHVCNPRIIHFDVKPANVLLDLDHSPKLTDFGLATLNDIEATHVTMSKIKGTMGFLAPEIFSPSERVTFKCDVYSFGMLLFEILGMAMNSQNDGWFPKYVWEKFKMGKLNDVIVERGIKAKDRGKATVLARVALWCIQHTPGSRPTMKTVVEFLEKGILPVKPPDPHQSSAPGTSMLPELIDM